MTVKGLLLTGAILLGSAVSANAAVSGSNAYFFGDSLTDCCVLGRTTNGPNWADLLPPQIGASYTATAQSNLAVQAAQSGPTSVWPLNDQNLGPTGFLTQVSQFTARNVSVGPNDIAGIWIGTNDIWPSTYTASTVLTVPGLGTARQPVGAQPSTAALTSYIIGNVQSGINQLKADGFQNIVLLSPYDLAQSTLTSPSGLSLATAYSDALTAAEAQLYTPGVNTYSVDVESLLRQVQANPGAYGFLHTTATDSCSANNCASLSPAQQDTYIFQDFIHFTTAFDRLIASDAAAVISAGQTVPAPVPEPASAALVLTGLTGIGLARGARKKAAA